jgi:hypothetical protein
MTLAEDDLVEGDVAAPPPRRARTGAALVRLGAAVPWWAALREFAIIVAGVLAALGAQAWWQHREDVGRERDYLRQLLADTRENGRRLDEAVARDSVTGVDAARLAAALYRPGPLPPPDTLLAWFTDAPVFSASDFRPLTGSYTALLTTGDIRLIRTDTLRSRLVGYEARLESERESLRFFFEQAFSDPGRLARALPFMRGTFIRDGGRPRTGAAAIDWAKIRGDPEVAAIMFSIQAANANRVAHLRGMRDETRELLRVLEAEPALREASAARQAEVRAGSGEAASPGLSPLRRGEKTCEMSSARAPNAISIRS